MQTLVLKTQAIQACARVTAEENLCATPHIVRVDTMFSPEPGVIQEGHCQPGTDPTPRTSQTE
jgi:hypothetical protein